MQLFLHIKSTLLTGAFYVVRRTIYLNGGTGPLRPIKILVEHTGAVVDDQFADEFVRKRKVSTFALEVSLLDEFFNRGTRPFRDLFDSSVFHLGALVYDGDLVFKFKDTGVQFLDVLRIRLFCG